MFQWKNLDKRTRDLMIEEINRDDAGGTLYYSKRLSASGTRDYVKNFKDAVTTGDETSLANRLRSSGSLQAMEPRGTGFAKVPTNAAEMLAEGEFNRFYIRALCRRAIDDGVDELTVYRAKAVSNPRFESEAKIGTAVDPHRLLADLRTHPGVDTALGLPSGPNSGLSVHLP